MITVPVGPFSYRVRLIKGYVLASGPKGLGLCDVDRCEIIISDIPQIKKRISLLWHEIAHAWKWELDIHQSESLDDEATANLIGLAMAGTPVNLIARLHCYMTTGIECDDVMLVSGLPPIPVIHFVNL